MPNRPRPGRKGGTCTTGAMAFNNTRDHPVYVKAKVRQNSTDNWIQTEPLIQTAKKHVNTPIQLPGNFGQVQVDLYKDSSCDHWIGGLTVSTYNNEPCGSQAIAILGPQASATDQLAVLMFDSAENVVGADCGPCATCS